VPALANGSPLFHHPDEHENQSCSSVKRQAMMPIITINAKKEDMGMTTVTGAMRNEWSVWPMDLSWGRR
jgi:hypothetical protein